VPRFVTCRPLEVSSLECSHMLGMEPELDLCKLRDGATKPAVVVWHRGGDVVTEALTAAVEAPFERVRLEGRSGDDVQLVVGWHVGSMNAR
jgi:hypothetical protein